MIAAVIGATGAAGALADDLYLSGFEPPDFAPGPLAGQDGWMSTNPGGALVSDAFPREGVQAVFVDAALGDGWWWRPIDVDPVAIGRPVIDVRVSMHLSDAGAPSGIWGLDVYDEDVARVTTWYVTDTGSLRFWDGAAGGPTEVLADVARGVWHEYRLRLDWARRSASLFLDGDHVATMRFDRDAAATLLADADLWLGLSGTDAAWFDGYEVRALCAADFDADGVVDSRDFVAFLNAFTAGEATADFNADGSVNSQDFVDFLNAFVAGC
jgi:hypothetical protein